MKSATILRSYDESKIRAYILDHINLEDYENQTLPENPVLACYEIFQMEYGWRSTQRGMNEQSAFREWLRGLPCLTVKYTYYEERELMRQWHVKSPRKNEIDDDMWVDDNYWDIITTVFFRMYAEAKRAA